MGLVVDVVVLVVLGLVVALDRCREVLVLVDLDRVVFNQDRDREVRKGDPKVRVITVLPIDSEVVVLERQQRRVLVPLELALV